MNDKGMQKSDQRLRPADGHSGCADGIFENQIPADDPGQEFAHGRVGISVGAAGDGNHGRELAVAKARKAAADGGGNEGKHNRWARVGGGRDTGQGENARADDGADAERDERRRTQRTLQTMLTSYLGFRENTLQRLYRE